MASKAVAVWVLCNTIVPLTAQIALPIYHLPASTRTQSNRPGSQQRHTSRRLQGATTMTESFDFVPYIDFQLGSDRQDVTSILLDTGSSPLWIPSSTCMTGCWPCNFNTTLYPNAYCLDSTFENVSNSTCGALPMPDLNPAIYSNNCTGSTGALAFNSATSTSFATDASLGPFLIQYGDGSTYIGNYAQDTLLLANTAFSNFIFSLITLESYNNEITLGIFGFAPPEYNEDSTLISTMVSDPRIVTKQFSLFYPSTLPGTGEVFIGGNRSSLYTGHVTWVPCYFQSYWNVAGDKVFMVSKDGSKTSSSGVRAILDTGTSWLVGPTADVTAVASWLNLTYDDVQQTYYGLCDHVNNLPNFYVQFAPSIRLMFNTSNNFNGGIYDSNSTGSYCYVAMQGGSDNPPMWIVGSIFIRQYYSIFDFTGLTPSTNLTGIMGTGKIGFATPFNSSNTAMMSGVSRTTGGGLSAFAVMAFLMVVSVIMN